MITPAPPSTLQELNRNDPQHARLIVEERLLPDPELRRQVLDRMLEVIRICEVKPFAWGATLRPDLAAVIASPLAVAQFRAREFMLCYNPREFSPDTLDWLQRSTLRSTASKTGAIWLGIDLDQTPQMPPELWEACLDTVRELIEKKSGRYGWWESHSPGFLAYLEEEMGVEIRFPDYSQAISGIRHWKIAPGAAAWQWEASQAEGFIGMGWPEFGDLRQYEDDAAFERARKQLVQEDPGEFTKTGCSQLWKFRSIAPGDRIIANRGLQEVLGVGTVTESYHFVPGKTSQPPGETTTQLRRRAPLPRSPQGRKAVANHPRRPKPWAIEVCRPRIPPNSPPANAAPPMAPSDCLDQHVDQ